MHVLWLCVCMCKSVWPCQERFLFNHLWEISNLPLKLNMKGNLLYFYLLSVSKEPGNYVFFFFPKLCFKSVEGTWLRRRKKKETKICSEEGWSRGKWELMHRERRKEEVRQRKRHQRLKKKWKSQRGRSTYLQLLIVFSHILWKRIAFNKKLMFFLLICNYKELQRGSTQTSSAHENYKMSWN